MWDWGTFVAALVPSALTLIGVIITNRKNAALISYRIEQLEKKQDKHNNVIERQFKLEQQVQDLKEMIVRKG